MIIAHAQPAIHVAVANTISAAVSPALAHARLALPTLTKKLQPMAFARHAKAAHRAKSAQTVVRLLLASAKRAILGNTKQVLALGHV